MQASFFFTLLAVLATLHVASATVTGFSVGKKPIVPGKKFTITFQTENAQSNNEQDYALFALSTDAPFQGTIGAEPFARHDIFKIHKGGKPFKVTLTAPKKLNKGYTYNLNVAIFGAVGQSGEITTTYHTEKVKVKGH